MVVPEVVTCTGAVGSTNGGMARLTLLMRSAALLFHRHMNVEDVPIRITYIQGAMAPRLGRQLLDPLDLGGFRTRAYSLSISATSNSIRTRSLAAPRTAPSRTLHTRTGATGRECRASEGKFDIVATIDLRADLQHRLKERTHLLKIGGYNRDECKFHQTPLLRGHVGMHGWADTLRVDGA